MLTVFYKTSRDDSMLYVAASCEQAVMLAKGKSPFRLASKLAVVSITASPCGSAT